MKPYKKQFKENKKQFTESDSNLDFKVDIKIFDRLIFDLRKELYKTKDPILMVLNY